MANVFMTLGSRVEPKFKLTFNIGTSVARLGDFLHFGQLFKAFDNNEFAQISHSLGQIL